MTHRAIVKRLPGKSDFGAYAEVFFIDGGRAMKVFKRRLDAEVQHVRTVFESEVAAYEIAASNEQLRCLVPAFFGRVCLYDVLDEAGRSIASEFILDCVYEMSFIEGSFIKLGELDSGKYLEVRRIFSQHGIRHVRDASVVLSPEGDIVSMIDFALEEHELEGDAL